jgi:phosphatidylinositol-3-phosphatase
MTAEEARGLSRDVLGLSRNGRRRRPALLLLACIAAAVLVGCQASPGPAPGPGASGNADPAAGTAASVSAGGKPGHVFVINLENKSYANAWGADSPAPYLSQTLRSQGVLLKNYYGIGHKSLPNYIAQLSGQGPNPVTSEDCHTYEAFTATGTAALAQVQGSGCVYPGTVPTLAGQLSAAGKSWKGYMEDMGTPCRHPEVGAVDTNQNASSKSQYATRHNPFVYFTAITSSPECEDNVVDFSNLTGDLESLDTTPNLSYITPNLCNDGHDDPCVDGSKGGLPRADEWLKQHVPAILESAAFRKDGILVITFDEAEHKEVSSVSLPGGAGGGRVGALVLSPQVKGGATSKRSYNHYSLLASIEDMFGLPYLGYAADPDLNRFGDDVYNNRS